MVNSLCGCLSLAPKYNGYRALSRRNNDVLPGYFNSGSKIQTAVNCWERKSLGSLKILLYESASGILETNGKRAAIRSVFTLMTSF